MDIASLRNQLHKELFRLEGSVALSVKFLGTQEVFDYNETNDFWAASVIKVPIACEFYKQVQGGKLSPKTKTRVVGENRVQGTGVIKLLDEDDEFTYLDLVTLMLVVSDNAATNGVIDAVGWENIEPYMQSIGLTSTTFKHKMMITAGRGPNLSTTKDITTLFEILYKNDIAGAVAILDILKKQQDRTRIPLFLPNEVEIAHKLGSLPSAMHDAGIIYTKNPFIFVFFSDDQKDKRLTNDVLSLCAKLCYEYGAK